ncbi:glycosyltransferase [Amycolatopsis azurea]|uniref:glycosyltransferase n=1 Tax=Amycolatopsis azurea TaxID=36819 RepID=UPI00380C4A6F
MKVLHLITGLAAGGAETQLRHLLRHTGADSDVITLTNPGSVATALRSDGVTVTDLGMRGNLDILVLPRLVRLIRRGRYDVVHTHLYRAMLYGRVAARLAGVRAIVATEHSLADTMLEGRPQGRPGVRELYLAAERFGHKTVAVSDRVAARLQTWGVSPTRIQVIPNGIDRAGLAFTPTARLRVRTELGFGSETMLIGVIARLAKAKRVDVAIKMLLRIPGAALIVAGDGELRADLITLAEELGVEDRVVFIGETADVAGLLSAVDILVSPSTEETFGLAVIEALAAGLPVVYASCPALEELPADAAPFARRARSAPDDFAAALGHLLALCPPGQSRSTPAAARHYDIARTAEALDELYSRLAGQP